jgi:hypothetical protein
MTANKKAPSWSKLHDWFVTNFSNHENGNGADSTVKYQQPLGQPVLADLASPKKDYQAFLENASRTMIRFKKPEHLIKMIVRTIDEQLKVTHTSASFSGKKYRFFPEGFFSWHAHPSVHLADHLHRYRVSCLLRADKPLVADTLADL